MSDNFEPKSPMISVIIPAFNVVNFLERCVNSIINQNFNNFEIIIVDDGSDDGTGELCLDLANGNKDISVVRQENAGVSAARNLGLQKSRGEWIFFLDADDWVDKDIFGVFESDRGLQNIDAIQFGHRLIREDGHILRETKPSNNTVFDNAEDLVQKNEYFLMNITFCFFRAQKVRELGLLFSNGIKYAEDLEFGVKFYSHCNGILQIDKVYYNYFVRNDSAMQTGVTIQSLFDHIDVATNLIAFFNIRPTPHKEFKRIQLSYMIKSFISRSLLTNWSRENKEKAQKYYNNFYDANVAIVGPLDILFRLGRINISICRFLYMAKTKFFL